MRADTGELTVYTAAACCLCDDARALLDTHAPRLGLTVRYVDITGVDELERAHRSEIPVGYLGGRKLFKYVVDVEQLQRRARWLAPG